MIVVHFKTLLTPLRANILLFGLLAAATHAAVPLSWETRPGSPAPVSFDRHHGETIDFRCTLHGFGPEGQTVFGPNADVRLYYQTNGMGQAWWSAPATVSSNVITATWSPDLDPGADRVSLFLGAPSNVYASAVLRLRHSPGFTPASLPLPVPSLDFAGIEVLHAPYYTQAETDARIVELSPAAQPPGNYLAVSNAAMHAVTFDEYGAVRVDRMQVHDLAVNGSPGWPTYRILFGPNDLDGTYLYWDADSGRFATWRTADGGDYLATALDVANSAVAASNYVHAVAVAATNYTDLATNGIVGGFRIDNTQARYFHGILWCDASYTINLGFPFDAWSIDYWLPPCTDGAGFPSQIHIASTSYVDRAISPTNPAFAAAVRNVPIAGADSSDLAEIAEYGSYGTVGAAILALIAGLAALKRGKVTGALGSGGWVVTNGQRDYVFASDSLADDDITIARIADLRYAKHMLTTPAGSATLLDRADNLYVGDSSFTSCTFTLPAARDGRIRDFLLDFDNSSNSSGVDAEFYGLGTAFAMAVNADDVSASKTAGEVLAEMTTVEANTRARFYFTETAQTVTVGGSPLPVISIQRLSIATATVRGGAA